MLHVRYKDEWNVYADTQEEMTTALLTLMQVLQEPPIDRKTEMRLRLDAGQRVADIARELGISRQRVYQLRRSNA